ncbi:unnamed protein product, partial [Mesorhabditis belari]|uniref:Uncharacterized protein n=1 Tax=Mesorhabditis belari TaxID=2138241 RepID=A0AAF3FB13_9BILA
MDVMFVRFNDIFKAEHHTKILYHLKFPSRAAIVGKIYGSSFSRYGMKNAYESSQPTTWLRPDCTLLPHPGGCFSPDCWPTSSPSFRPDPISTIGSVTETTVRATEAVITETVKTTDQVVEKVLDTLNLFKR